MSDPIQVLLVDDDAMVLGAMALLLRSAGMTVTSLASAAKARQSLAEAGLRPDVLLLDYWLGDQETGADLAEHIARTLGYRIPTIIYSGQLFNAEVPWIPGTPLMLASKPMDADTLIDTLTHFAAWQRKALARAAGQRRSVPEQAA